MICDIVPSQIFPVKPVFGVITKKAAILTGSKYHLTESTPEAWTPVIINSQCSSIKWIERSTEYVLPRIQVCMYVCMYQAYHRFVKKLCISALVLCSL